jgi:hypothetical protein
MAAREREEGESASGPAWFAGPGGGSRPRAREREECGSKWAARAPGWAVRPVERESARVDDFRFSFFKNVNSV